MLKPRRLLLMTFGLVVTIILSTSHTAYVIDAQGQRTPRATRSASTRTPGQVQSSGLTATALAGKYARTGSAEAAQAITVYASEVLGTQIVVQKAGGVTTDVVRAITQTDESSNAQSATVKLAVKNYSATLKNGAATLSYGDGTVTGDVAVDVQGASLGVYSLTAAATGQIDANAALSLAKATYPALAVLPYTPYSVTSGYAWYVSSTAPGLDPKTGKATAISQAVLLYVLPVANGRASVTATVGRGTFATQVVPPKP
jgi:hypothetical protein